MPNYKQDLSTEPGAYLNGKAKPMSKFYRGSTDTSKSMHHKKERAKSMRKGK